MNSFASISVMIVDDSPVVRHGIRAVIESEPSGQSLAIVGQCGTAEAALRDAPRLKPDVILVDLRLPDRCGLSACRQLRQLLPASCVLVLASATDNESVYESVLAGAHGYLPKEIDPISLIQAIKHGHAGRPVFPAGLTGETLGRIRAQAAQFPLRPRGDPLSPQEQKVLAAIAAGLSNKEIAGQLGLSANTVRNYIANLFQKLGVRRRAQAAAHYLHNQPA